MCSRPIHVGRITHPTNGGPLNELSHSHCRYRETHSTMTTAALSALGYAGFGFLARCYALGIQKRNIFDNFAGHLLFAGGFGLIGYWAHGVKQSQEQLLHKKQEQLVERRQA